MLTFIFIGALFMSDVNLKLVALFKENIGKEVVLYFPNGKTMKVKLKSVDSGVLSYEHGPSTYYLVISNKLSFSVITS